MCAWALSWRMISPATSNWGRFLCIFRRSSWSRGSRKFFSCCPKIFKSICQKFHNSFFLSFDVLGLPGLGFLCIITQPLRKRLDLPQGETVLRSTVNSSQASLKAPWISVGFFPRKVLILTLIVPRAWEIGYTQKCQGKSTTHFVYFWIRKTLPYTHLEANSYIPQQGQNLHFWSTSLFTGCYKTKYTIQFLWMAYISRFATAILSGETELALGTISVKPKHPRP